MKQLFFKIIDGIQTRWWIYEGRIQKSFNEAKVQLHALEDPFWYIDQKTWSIMVMNVNSRGYSYYAAEVELWLDRAIKENFMMDENVIIDFTIDDIQDAFKIMSIMKMINVGINMEALDALMDLDTSIRDMTIDIILNK
jgi:hypothetical protein